MTDAPGHALLQTYTYPEKARHFAGVALQYLKGKTIVDAFYLNDQDKDLMGWSTSGVVLVLDTGAQLFAQLDAEGNGPAALIYATTEAEVVLPVL